MSFTHLHVHTDYSLLDGACKVDSLVADVKKAGMPAVAITDHGNMFGAIEFYKAAKKAGIKPIIGMESYIAPKSRFDRNNATRSKEASYHLPLLAYSTKGYYNLVKLSSLAYIEGFYFRPRIDKEILEKHHEGLIGLSGCLAGEVCQNILNNKYEEACEVARFYSKLFGPENFYIEIQHNGLDIQEIANEGLIRLARDLSLPLVATNDVHYLTKADYTSHDCLLCLQTGRKKNETNRFKFPSDQFYLKSTEEMKKEFAHVPEIFDNIQKIVDKVNIEIEFNKYYLPKFEVPGGFSDTQYLEKIALEGLERRYKTVEQKHLERLTKEIKIIDNMGFSSYFLIVWDFIKFAHQSEIPVGPGRGSGAGSIIAYAIGITDIDPLKYDLLFERFLNPGRRSMPDFDIDFCQERRQEVIDYVYKKYGENNVSQIITFGTMGAKGVLRDVGRVLDIPLPTTDKIAKMIPTVLNITLEEALKQEKDLRDLCDTDPQIKELFKVAMALEGQCRHASTHAAGVVISDKPISEHIPLYKSKDGIATQYTMSIVEECGLLKMDFLGLQTLTVIKKTFDSVLKNHGIKLNNDEIPIDDKETFEMMQKGETIGVFQLESSGFREVISRLKPDRFEDIIALVAMYRPGPLESGMVDTYIDVKNGVKEAVYEDPILKEVLEETYGVILYQEQVMRIANLMAGFSLEESDNLRKAMGKKIPEIMAKYREKFIKGSEQNGIASSLAAHVYDNIEKFAGYGFNKSHSAAYAMIAYRTAYLKCKYPEEFLSALMTCDMGNTDKLVVYIEECKRLGFDILPPDINDSDWGFKPLPQKIRFALGAIKGVGHGPVEEIIKVREKGDFKSIYDFCDRSDIKKVGKANIEILTKAGCFSSLDQSRARTFATLETAIELSLAKSKEKASGQSTLFGDDEFTEENDFTNAKIEFKEWDLDQILGYEKEYLGMYLTGHPLGQHAEMIKKFSTIRILDIPQHVSKEPAQSEGGFRKRRKEYLLGGMIASIKLITTKKQDKMAAIVFEDLDSAVNCIVFPKAYNEYKHLIQESAIVFLKCEIDDSREELQLIVNKIIPFNEVRENMTKSMILRINDKRQFSKNINQFKKLFQETPGTCPVMLQINFNTLSKVILKLDSAYNIRPNPTLENAIKKIEPEIGIFYDI